MAIDELGDINVFETLDPLDRGKASNTVNATTCGSKQVA
jgi:hypothetical protein